MDIEQSISRAEQSLAGAFRAVDAVETENTRRILLAFQQLQVSYRHFAPSVGYGYDDIGRDTLAQLFAAVFGTEAAIVRPQIASGTAALALAITALVKPGDHVLSATGTPYDTLNEVIGYGKPQAPAGSLAEMRVNYDEVPLSSGGGIDLAAVDRAIRPETRLVIAQRSRGYDWRPSLQPEAFSRLAELLHTRYPQITLLVDNCYGEFVCTKEPSHYGADVCVGSLIKNPGGGLAPTGAYIAGRQSAIDRIAARLTAPGVGLEVGSYAASYQPFYQGLFLAPHTVAQALKTAMLAARLFEDLGMQTTPASNEPRADIIQAIRLERPERLIRFCQGIQLASPVDSMALPEPWDMPGYEDQVIMAAGTFVPGASIELSADGPMRPPYIAYLQGALTYAHGRLALASALRRMLAEE